MAPKLDGKEPSTWSWKLLEDAFVRAFPTSVSLERMVQYTLGVNIHAIVADVSLSEKVFQLLRWAESQGRLGGLIAGASRENPQLLRWLPKHLHSPVQLPEATEPCQGQQAASDGCMMYDELLDRLRLLDASEFEEIFLQMGLRIESSSSMQAPVQRAVSLLQMLESEERIWELRCLLDQLERRRNEKHRQGTRQLRILPGLAVVILSAGIMLGWSTWRKGYRGDNLAKYADNAAPPKLLSMPPTQSMVPTSAAVPKATSAAGTVVITGANLGEININSQIIKYGDRRGIERQRRNVQNKQ